MTSGVSHLDLGRVRGCPDRPLPHRWRRPDKGDCTGGGGQVGVASAGTETGAKGEATDQSWSAQVLVPTWGRENSAGVT